MSNEQLKEFILFFGLIGLWLFLVTATYWINRWIHLFFINNND
jgi:hypothetical protein